MSEAGKQEPSYFDVTQEEEVPVDKSEPTSPLSLPSKLSQRLAVRPTRPHLTYDTRSKSAFAVLQSRFQNQTIREDVKDRDETSPYSTVRTGVQDPSSSSSRPISSRLRPNQSALRPLASKTSLVSQTSHSAQSSGEPKTASQRESQVLFYNQRLKSTLIEGMKDRRTTSSNESPGTTRSERFRLSSDLPTSSLQPLRPPLVRSGLSSSRSNPNIRIEKSFTMAEPSDSGSHSSRRTVFTRGSRRSSLVNPRLLLSSSVALFRKKRSAGQRPSKDPAVEARRSDESFNERTNRPSGPERGETATGLKRVSSLLQDVETLRQKGKTSSLKSLSSGNSRSMGSGRSCDAPKCSNMLERVESMQMALDNTSQSSSLQKLRMGITPHNTPEEQATYIALNQDNELEEFFKIDISIRGQTSYLPSEARRVHTPPMPSEGPDGRKRGFFFDYDIAKEIERRKSQRHDGPFALTKSASPYSRTSGSSATSRVPTISQGFSLKMLRRSTRVKTGDWYSTQLAELDSLPDSVSIDTSPRPTHPNPSVSESGRQSGSQQEQLDYNVPEHLPTSPLCPRHPGYWRVVKKKGSQFRGC